MTSEINKAKRKVSNYDYYHKVVSKSPELKKKYRYSQDRSKLRRVIKDSTVGNKESLQDLLDMINRRLIVLDEGGED